MQKLFLKIALMSLLISCSNNRWNIENQIEDYIKKNCETKSQCVIDINEVLSFEWDSFVVFKETSTSGEVTNVLGMNYPYYEAVEKRIVFLNQEKIVYHDDVYPSVSSLSNGEIVFEIPDTLNYRFFKSSEFIVNQIPFDKGVYYHLTPIEN